MTPNPMMAALEQSRQNNPVSSSGPTPGIPAQQQNTGNPGQDMAKYWSMMQEMSVKIDKILESLSNQYQGNEPDTQNDGNEAQEK